MSSIDAVGSNFLELEWKFRKYFIGQNIKGNGILPDPEFFKTSKNRIIRVTRAKKQSRVRATAIFPATSPTSKAARDDIDD